MISLFCMIFSGCHQNVHQQPSLNMTLQTLSKLQIIIVQEKLFLCQSVLYDNVLHVLLKKTSFYLLQYQIPSNIFKVSWFKIVSTYETLKCQGTSLCSLLLGCGSSSVVYMKEVVKCFAESGDQLVYLYHCQTPLHTLSRPHIVFMQSTRSLLPLMFLKKPLNDGTQQIFLSVVGSGFVILHSTFTLTAGMPQIQNFS